jgi:hypothetical protein
MKIAKFFRSLKNLQNRSCFSSMVHPIELKFFQQVLKTFRGASFFYFEKYCIAEFWQILQERHYSNKNMRFLGCSPYFDFFIRREQDRKEPDKIGTLKCP